MEKLRVFVIATGIGTAFGFGLGHLNVTQVPLWPFLATAAVAFFSAYLIGRRA